MKTLLDFLSNQSEDRLVLYAVVGLIALYLIMQGIAEIVDSFKRK